MVIRLAEHDIAHLIDWANEARDFTTNQGVKPSLIYIINQDNRLDIGRWSDSKYATEEMLKKWRSCKRFTQEQSRWRARGAMIETAEQLLRCYYNDIRVIYMPEFLPDRSRCSASELRKQYQTLYEQINQQSWIASKNKQEINLLFDLGAFTRSSVQVLEQLTKDPLCTIDLKVLSEPLRDQPTSFVSHVLNLLSRLQRESRMEDDVTAGKELRLMKRVLPYVVICISGEVLRAQGALRHTGSTTLTDECRLRTRWQQRFFIHQSME